MNTKPVLILGAILIAGAASAFTASRVVTTYLYQPNGTTFYTSFTSTIECPILNQVGCTTFINGIQGTKQLYTTFNGLIVPVKPA